MQTSIHEVKRGIARCFIVSSEGAVLVVDTGVSGGEPGHWQRAFGAAGTRPDQTRLIVITHGHDDHTGGAAELVAITGAPVAMHRDDAAWLDKGQAVPAVPAGWMKAFGFLMRGGLEKRLMGPAPRFRRDILLGDEDFPLQPYGIQGRVVATPGHTRGSVSVVLDNSDAFVGDLAMSGMPALPPYPAAPVIAADIVAVRASWQRLLDLGARQFYPAHGAPFSAAALQRLLAR